MITCSSVTNADFIDKFPIEDIPDNWEIKAEGGSPGKPIFIEFTGFDQKVIRNPDMSSAGKLEKDADANGEAVFKDLPTTLAGKAVRDFIQSNQLPDPPSGSDTGNMQLHVGAFEPFNNDFLVDAPWNVVANTLGFNVGLEIPNLIADTNGDGVIDEDDTLFISVNVIDFIPGMVEFELGDTFDIIGSVSSSLPGMFFSDEPILGDPSSDTGFLITSELSLTAIARGKTIITAIPEPSTIALFCVGIAGLACVGPRRKLKKVVLG